MKTLIAALLLSILNLNSAVAATDSQRVDGLDTLRQGQLAETVLTEFKTKYKLECDGPSIPKYEILKVASSFANDEKIVNSPYWYAADYLVVQKCLEGSTFSGGTSTPVKTLLMKASFHATSDTKGGPGVIDSLKIEVLKMLDITDHTI